MSNQHAPAGIPAPPVPAWSTWALRGFLSAFAAAILAFGGVVWRRGEDNGNAVRLLDQSRVDTLHRLDRIEGKLDRLLERR